MINPIKVESIGEEELCKAACCNLSESFETNPSVDISFTDAITGTKQIQMLGLAGPYTQITRENMPDIKGLSAIYGMEYIPGPWIEGIQLNKGTGSVVNGFEGIAGQINVELRKPETAERVYLNVFGNTESRIEANLNLARKVNKKWSTALLFHGRNQSFAMDKNNDGFIDKPTGNQYILLNRWHFASGNGWISQFGIKGTLNSNIGGQAGFNPKINEGLWGMEMETKRLESWMKIGKVSAKKPFQSYGFQLSGLIHDQSSVFGNKQYSGMQKSGYINFIFQSAFSDIRHKYKLGTSIQGDGFSERLDSMNFDRNEVVPGAFFEYTFSPHPDFDIVTGLRSDYHNNYGIFITPRVHLRYALKKKSVIRLSAGRGQRTASILAENMPVFASGRSVVILDSKQSAPYNLSAEKAWNFGVNFTQKFRLDYRDGSISFDLYHTTFKDQVVVDLDYDPQQILFYNLDGKSFSTSFQSQFDYEVLKRLDLRLAYRWYNVKTNYINGIKAKPLVSKNRAFLNLAYATRKQLKLDYTIQWYGSKRIPETSSNPEEYRLEGFSPDFFLMNAQISKEWNEKFEIYFGAENLLGYKQSNPILASNYPFGQYFDSSLIWGPVFGRMIYAGLRLRIK
jgi:outer membrane receptor for ferrienterochelin and colicin